MKAELATRAGIEWQPAQLAALDLFETLREPERLCLYYPTGAGKTLTALACVAMAGHRAVLVVAPPSTHQHWRDEGTRLGVVVTVVSHAKFRQPSYRLARDVAVIADEFHLFGGIQGKGWKKLNRLAAGLAAPLIICSATPNYNDAERCYCVQHIIAPQTCTGGILSFIYNHCTTRENPFAQMPYVEGFKNHPAGAAGYLGSLPNVAYLPDPSSLGIIDIEFPRVRDLPLELYGLDVRTGRVVASMMEKRHSLNRMNLLTDAGNLRPDLHKELKKIIEQAPAKVVVFCASKQVLIGVVTMLNRDVSTAVVHGDMSTTAKLVEIERFTVGVADVLVGTAALATGTDGLDKVSDTLVIVDDTDDDALRRQLMGRILPRGLDTDESGKAVYRFVHV